jgi:two-component system NtrC family sensor kinase
MLDEILLIVDDDEVLLRANVRLLKKAGYKVSFTTSGQSALQMIREIKPDLVLLDVVLNDGNGFDICRTIKSDPELAGIFVVLLSGVHIESESKVNGLETGADGYIVRPVSNDELIARVRALFRIKNAEKKLKKQIAQLTLLNQIGTKLAGLESLDNIFSQAADSLQSYFHNEVVEIKFYEIDSSIYDRNQPDEVAGGTEICIPISTSEEKVGIINIKHREKDAIEDNDVILLETIANQIGAAIENVLLNQELRQELDKRRLAEAEIRKYSEGLEDIVAVRTKKIHEMQEELIRNEKLVVLGQLSGGIAHELRNPLSAIKNVSYYLDMVVEDQDPNTQEMLEILKREIKNSEGIIDSLLTFARSKTPLRRNVSIDSIIDDAISRLVIPFDIQVVKEVPEDFPELFLDPDQLVHVFVNLIKNAVQAITGPGEVFLVVKNLENKWAEISISDTGRGMSVDERSNLFQPLISKKLGGTGLGLVLSKALVEGHGGKITVGSSTGIGSEFIVDLPINYNVRRGSNE